MAKGSSEAKGSQAKGRALRWQVVSATFERSAPRLADCPEGDLPEIAADLAEVALRGGAGDVREHRDAGRHGRHQGKLQQALEHREARHRLGRIGGLAQQHVDQAEFARGEHVAQGRRKAEGQDQP